MDSNNKILYKEESFKIIGACMKVHRSLGTGFLEAVYEEVLEKEFLIQNIPFKRQLKLELYYENEKLKKQYRADFVCYDAIILEIKSVSHIPNTFYAQLKNYLKCTKMELGMLINFGMPSLFYKRIINMN
ncbi:GxxExxY protein [uncultured Flavobacterium sp.]|uniref:GxxExxY protein n=1 Tax=uncultured Flavobacterium sp. TaxID=165435 RepID=UPI0030EEFBB9|tara:strand:+ start:1076 stop:1465 length:390 start_codon:yes stop_codon:yes gene_type:complete